MRVKGRSKRTNPNAMVFVYNYRDRMGDADSAQGANGIKPGEVDQIILNTTSLLSISTNKSKSQPAGSFEIRLAPTKNWVTAITPGSWCIILMSNSAIDDKAKYGGGRVDEKSFKMLGRIESVRGVIEVDQKTGARKTGYIVQGADWGTIFDTTFYMDPINRGGNESALNFAMRVNYLDFLKKGLSFDKTATGPKANEASPATTRPKTEASAKPADRSADFFTGGTNAMASNHTNVLRAFTPTASAADFVKDIIFDSGVASENAEIERQRLEAAEAAEASAAFASRLKELDAESDPSQQISEGPTFEQKLKIEAARTKEANNKKAAADAEAKRKQEAVLKGTFSTGTKLPSAGDNVAFLLKLWGQVDQVSSAVLAETKLLGKSQQVFKLPKEAAEYMQFKRGDTEGNNDGKKKVSNVISDVLTPIVGKLKESTRNDGFSDRYEGKDKSAGIIDFNTVLGEHSFWQVLNDNCNSPINELIPEIRFAKNGQATLALYQRVRPFAVKTKKEIMKDDKEVGGGTARRIVGPLRPNVQETNETMASAKKTIAANYFSRFENVRTKKIDVTDIINCNFGTNWRDKYNFVEVNINRSLFKEAWSTAIKLESQFKDSDSIGRDGLKSMIQSFAYLPTTENGIQSVLDTFVYKYALKEWYFNTHKMLNGNIQLVGQDQYIQVGDNIRVKAEALGLAKNISAAQKKSRSFTYMTAHVESISHNVQVDRNGARTFITNINFIRGIITDINGKLIAEDGNAGAVDQDAAKVTPSVEKNTGVLGSSGPNDPDRQKLKGK